ncbi:hypothetical protein BH11VER1_BH11VER1_33770 [soil metagenome]
MGSVAFERSAGTPARCFYQRGYTARCNEADEGVRAPLR